MSSYDALYDRLCQLVLHHSPSGVEGELDALLRTLFGDLGIDLRSDASGNLVAKIAGKGKGRIAITAHKDEIGAIVTSVEDDGRVKVRKLGGSFPWVYGEGIVDLLGDARTISGVLSFGSRHVSHASPQHAFKETAPLKWSDVWIETKLTVQALTDAGVRPGTRVVVGKHRKAPFRLGDHVASYTLDNKASVAILLGVAERLSEPLCDVYLVATAKEEVGAVGALYFTAHEQVDALVALEVCPVAPEYTVKEGVDPVLVVEDGFALYDEALNEALRAAARRQKIPLQLAMLSGFGSDAAMALKQGHVARGACLGFPTQNTHGYEISHLGALSRCIDILSDFCNGYCVDNEGVRV